MTVRQKLGKGGSVPSASRMAPHGVAHFPDLTPFLHPASIAVVGASDRTGGDAHPAMWRKIRIWAETTGADLYPVNPRLSTLDGHPCLSSIAELPPGIDLAAVFVGADRAIEVLPTLEAVGVKFALIFASGFAEAGKDGLERQRRLEEALSTTRLRVIGPNTNVNSFEILDDNRPNKRAVAVVTQSGGLGRAIVEARIVGFPCHRWIPTGNEVDLEFADFIAAFSREGAVGAVAAYIEGLRSGERFLHAAAIARREGVPVVVLKVGRSEQGRHAAQSHTGHLAGSDDVMRGVFRQAGVVRVDDLDQLIEVSNAMANSQPPEEGQGAAIYGFSGGAIVLTADSVASAGVSLPRLAKSTQKALREWIPGYLPVSNPVDSGWTATRDWRNRKILETILGDRRVGLLICPITGVYRDGTDSFDRSLQDMVDVSRELAKPIFVIWAGSLTDDPAFRDILVPSGLPVFRSVSNCARAAAAFFDYHAHRRSHLRGTSSGNGGSVADANRRATLPMVHNGAPKVHALLEPEAKSLLEHYGLAVSDDRLCKRQGEAVRAARSLGFPVILKVVHPDVVHRSAMGLIEQNVRTEPDLRAAWRSLEARLLEQGHEWNSDARGVTGILVSRQLDTRLELALGAVQDPIFGSVVMLAIGGINIELAPTTVFRTSTMQKADARDMVRELFGSSDLRLLARTGVRERTLCDAVLKVAHLARDYGPMLRELDVNPLAVTRTGLVALDAYAVLSSAAP